MKSLVRKLGHWVLLPAVLISSLPLAYAADRSGAMRTSADYEAVCSFLQHEDERAAGIIAAHGGPARDRFIAQLEQGARAYRFSGNGVRIDYVMTSDERMLIHHVQMTRPYLKTRLMTEEWLAKKLHVPLPLPRELKLGCDFYDLLVSATQGRISSLKISAFID